MTTQVTAGKLHPHSPSTNHCLHDLYPISNSYRNFYSSVVSRFTTTSALLLLIAEAPPYPCHFGEWRWNSPTKKFDYRERQKYSTQRQISGFIFTHSYHNEVDTYVITSQWCVDLLSFIILYSTFQIRLCFFVKCHLDLGNKDFHTCTKNDTMGFLKIGFFERQIIEICIVLFCTPD